MTSLAALLLLSDSRLPAGGHAHSGGLAAAVERGSVHDIASLEAFLSGRLQTAGLVAAGVAARAAALAGHEPPGSALRVSLLALDAEVDARTPSPAARTASRAQGRGLLRAAAVAWPSATFASVPPHPHAPLALGVVAVAAGCGDSAGHLAALQAVTGPAGAALRLLGLDPFSVTALLARLAPFVDDVAGRAAGPGPLPAAAAPLLDLLAQAHHRTEVRLFAS